ncbi:hypothetical protein BC332_05796 [Capsicum chinense]|nr:hypothetical protein BC332_05796 [Capsicum chinense]
MAGKPRNISPVLDFLIAKGIEDCHSNASAVISGAFATYFSVAKRVGLYFALICPQRTIDYLVYQLAQRMLEDNMEPLWPSANRDGPLMGVLISTGSLQSRHVSPDSGDYHIDTPNIGEERLHLASGTHVVNAKELQSALQGHQQHLLTYADIALILLTEIAHEND